MAALFLSAPLALAAPKLAVVEVSSPPTMVGLSAQVTQSVILNAQAQGFSVALPDEVREHVGPNNYDELRTCAGKLACVSSSIRGMAVDRVVLGTLGRNERHYLLRLWLIDLKRLAVVAEVDRSILIASRRLSREIEEAVPRLLKGQSEAKGTLELTTNVRGAEVMINGLPIGLAPLKIDLKPGKHEVIVQKDKYLSVTRLVSIEASGYTKEEVRLLLIPGETPDEETPELVKQAPDQGGRVLPWLKWVAGGVSVAAAGTGVALGLHAKAVEQELLDAYYPARDLYGGTRAQAIEARNSALAANILFGVAVGAAAAGVGFWLLLPMKEAPKVSVTPVAAPGAGGIRLEGSF